jgi:LuxR family maltose regulon positive regulatory protein
VVTTPLLGTKLHAPTRRRELVVRSRLNDRLTRGHEAALTVVSAPAGFGKTTAVVQWLATAPSSDRATAWLSLDERDNDPTVFWAYVVAAIQTTAPGIGADALSLLESGQSSAEAGLTSLLNELDAVAREIVLVLDDYHLIESAGLHDAMAFLIEHLPPHVHLVLATRADPPLPLARLRARGDVVEIRAADLRFTADETAAYLNESMGLAVDADDLQALGARTEGWIAALQLAALSMQDRDDVADFVASFAGNDRFVVDYLVEEVLERQPEPVRRFLLETAVLDRLTGSLCDAITGGSDGRSMLETLDRANLFLVPLDDRRRWYRYHHLFADVLRARLLDEDPDRVRELHRRAAVWFDAEGDRPEAIEHALAGGDVDLAAQLVELAAPLMRQARQEATLRGWLEALPDELFPDRPVLTLALVGARMATGDATGVEPLLQLVESSLERPTPPPIVIDEEQYAELPAQLAVYRAALALLAGDIDATVAHASRVLELAGPTDHLRCGAASALLGLAHWSLGDLEAARSRYTDAVQHFVAAHHLPDVLGCSLGLADIQLAQGRLHDATQTFTAGLHHATATPGLRGTADMHVGLSEVLLERNDLDAAARHLRESTDLGEHAGLPQNAYRGRVATARLRQSRGDLDGAIELLAEAEPLYNTDFSPAVRPVVALKARVQLARGDLLDAERWAADRGLTADDELTYVREFEHLTLARILLARGTGAPGGPESLERAIGLLDRLRSAAEAGGRAGSVVEALVLLAVARHAADDDRGAIDALTEALARAEPEGYVRPFLDQGPALTTLLREVARDGTNAAYARKVLAALSASEPPPPSSSPAALIDELSARELEVLRLLRTDLSGPEIARELIVSLNTMRTHTKSIYAKLGVTSRRAAVRRADELGL